MWDHGIGTLGDILEDSTQWFFETYLRTGEQNVLATRYSSEPQKVNENYRFTLNLARPNLLSAFPYLALVYVCNFSTAPSPWLQYRGTPPTLRTRNPERTVSCQIDILNYYLENLPGSRQLCVHLLLLVCPIRFS